MESRLLGKHVRDHIEHPPLNRQQPLKVLQQLFEAIGQLAKVQVDDQLEERVLGTMDEQFRKIVTARSNPNL